MNNQFATWSRKLWAVEFLGGKKETTKVIISDEWAGVREPNHDGEPSRCLLFQTRKQAVAWCKKEEEKVRRISRKWKFKPVRVMEMVVPANRRPSDA